MQDKASTQIVFGTAGHIDHGKSAIVKALTGEDPDRLKEEKARGISIDLGFAFLDETIAFVDVPGHERFIKNMVAGASGIDAALLMVAADDGVMPQTREHLEILQMLDIKSGLIVLTKSDLADEEWKNLVLSDIAELVKGTFLEGTPVIRTSAVAAEGIDELKQQIIILADSLERPAADRPFRMPVDRIFTIHGFGTVLTGTVKQGSLSVNDRVELYPSGRKSKVRRLEAHGKEVSSVSAGNRAAVNIGGIGKEEVERGEILVAHGSFRTSYMINSTVSVSASADIILKNNQKVKIHLHTSEQMGRLRFIDTEILSPGETGYVQVRLEHPVSVQHDDRFIIRMFSPQMTIAGGKVLHPFPRKLRGDMKAYLPLMQELDTGNMQRKITAMLKMEGPFGLSYNDLRQFFGMNFPELEPAVNEVAEDGDTTVIHSAAESVLISGNGLQRIKEDLMAFLRHFHAANPTRAGFPKGELTGFFTKKYREGTVKFAIGELIKETEVKENAGLISCSSFSFSLSPRQKTMMAEIEGFIKNKGLLPPKIREICEEFNEDEREIRYLVTNMKSEGRIIELDDQILIHSEILDRIKKELFVFLEKKGKISLAEFRDLFNTTRKFTVPMLDHFDREGLTVRDGDFRTLYKV